MNRRYKHEDVVQMLVDVIEQIEENEGIEIVDRPMGWESVRDYAEEVVSDIPSAENKGEWIPCSERLPNRQGHYICTCKDGSKYKRTTVVKWSNGWQLTGARSYWIVLAWMPLPEPWEGADNDRPYKERGCDKGN